LQSHAEINLCCCLSPGSYNDQEFVRIGYYVNNEYSVPFDPEHPPNPVDVNLLYRNILADQPRVTRFAVHWTAAEAAAAAAAAAASSAASTSPNGVAVEGDDEGIDLEEMEGDEEDDDDEDEEDEDENAEIDIEAEDEEMSNEDEEDEEEGGEDQRDTDNVIMCEDSMDVLQMQQIGLEASMSAHSNPSFA
jgi:histone chaperone ASF1